MSRRRASIGLPVPGAGGNAAPFTIAPMAYLAILALALALALNALVERWDDGLADVLTVQVPPGPDAAATAERVERARAALLATPGVLSAEPLSTAELERLLGPWLDTAALEALPLARLIDARVDPGAAPDLTRLRAAVSAAVPGASVDDHSLWLSDLERLAGLVRMIALGILATVGAAAAATIVSVTRAGLAIARPVVELLHVLGATDQLLARQFQWHAMSLTLRGGLIGLVLAMLTLGLLLGLGGAVSGAGLDGPLLGGGDATILHGLTLGPVALAALAGVPLAMAALAAVTARVTALQALSRLP